MEFNDRRFSGEVETAPPSTFSVEYARQKAVEFQQTLNAVDAVAQESWAMASVLPDGPERDAILEGMAEFESKRSSMKAAAEGINLGAAALNAVGGRFPVLSIPPALGLPALAMPAAAVAAFTLAASLIAWAVAWNRTQVARINAASSTLALIEDPAQRAEVAAEIARIQARAEAAASAGDSPLASLANVAKWAGIAVLGFLAYRAFVASRKA